MRTLLLIVVLGSLLPLALVYPHVGLLLWGWLAVMQPHQEVWSLPPWLQLNLITALVTILCWLVSSEPKLPPAGPIPILLGILLLWMGLSQIYSLRPQHSWVYLDRDFRVLVFAIMSMILLRNRTRIHAMVWVLVVSIGYHGVIGGGFTLLTAGQARVYGPPDSMIGDNNLLGLALVITLPFLNYLRQQSRHRLVRVGLIVTMALCVVAIFGTQSRGTLIAFSVLCLLFITKAKSKLVAILLIGTVGLGVLYFTPERWQERMSTIATAEEDSSFQSRVDAWIIAYEIAKARPLVGAGLRVPYLQDAVDPFLSKPREARAAHSIFFEFLGSLGFAGLGILLAILYFTWRNLRWIARHARDDPHLRWAYDLAQNGQLSFVAFLVGGSAVSLEFWEGFWLLVAIAHRLRWVVEQQRTATHPDMDETRQGLVRIPADRLSLRR